MKPTTMTEHRLFSMPFADVYQAYVNKAARKGRTQEEVDRVITWFTGYDQATLALQIETKTEVGRFFEEAPAMHPNRALIVGVVCGVRVENVEDPRMKTVRQLDKLIDELAKGRVHAVTRRDGPSGCIVCSESTGFAATAAVAA